jgi:hypothetical protein
MVPNLIEDSQKIIVKSLVILLIILSPIYFSSRFLYPQSFTNNGFDGDSKNIIRDSSNSVQNSSKASDQQNPPETIIEAAPSVDSFFEKYNDDYLQPMNSLPDPINNTHIPSAADPSDISVNIDLSKVAYNENETINYSIQATSNMLPVSDWSFRLVVIEGDDYYRWFYDIKNITIIIDEIKTTNDEGFYFGTLEPLSKGSYTILIMKVGTQKDYWPYARRVFTVANTATFWRVPYQIHRNEEINSYGLIASITDFSPLEGVNVSLFYESYSYNSTTWLYDYDINYLMNTKSDENGLFSFQFIFNSSDENYYNSFLLKIGNETDYLPIRHYFYSYNHYYDNYQKIDFITTKDKPLYQPGETIKTRVLVVENDYYQVTKRPLVNSSVEVLFQDPRGFTLFHDILTTNEHANFEWLFTLDNDAMTGNYHLICQKEGFETSINIPVERYEKPDFEVTIELDSTYVPPGEMITGKILAEYYFGKPVIGTALLDFTYHNNSLGIIEKTLNADGEMTFSWEIPEEYNDEEINSITLEATITDTVDRTVTQEVEITCQSNLFTYLYTSPYSAFEKNDTIIAYFSCYQILNSEYYWLTRWAPVTNASVKIELFGINDTKTALLFSLDSRTNQRGYGRINFTIPEEYFSDYQEFKLKLEVTTNDGREGTDERNICLKKVTTIITINPKNNINPGDEVQICIKLVNIETGNYASGRMSFYIYDSEFDTIARIIETELEGENNYSLNLGPYVPEGEYYIRTFCEIYNAQDNEYYAKYSCGGAVFLVGDNLELSLTTDKNQYNFSDKMIISGSINFDTNLPIILEITKRGIVTKIAIEPINNTFSLQINDLSLFAPKITLFAYAISSSGEVCEQYLQVIIDANIQVSLEADKETYAPGETAIISISVSDSTGESIPALSALSLIDSSIFAIKEDSLSEEEYFSNDNYYPTLSTVTSWTSPMPYYWYYWYLDESYDGSKLRPTGPYYDFTQEAGTGYGVLFEESLRDNLPESTSWIPNLEITAEGISLAVILPDNIGEWTVRAFVTAQGDGVIAKTTFKTFLPFFVDLKVPLKPVQDDVIIVQGIVYNYLSLPVNVSLQLIADSLTILNAPNQTIFLPNDYLINVQWTVYCDSFHSKNITLYAIANDGIDNYYDAIRRPINITPNAVSLSSIESGFFNSTQLLEYDLYKDMISLTANLVLSPGLMDVAITSWERLVGYPYGCIEQTISKIIPDIFIYHYLEERSLLTEEWELKLNDMLQKGLSRIATHQHNDGGWGWWRDDSSQSYMTAVVLYGLGLLQDFDYQLDEEKIDKAITFLLDQQTTDGGFITDNWRLDELSFSCYVLRSLFSVNINTTKYSSSITNLIQYIETTWNIQEEERNPYAAALYIESLYNSTFVNPAFIEDLSAYLLSSQKINSDGYYWEIDEEHYWRPLGGTTETTATVINALVTIDSSGYYLIIKKAVEWLIEQQNYWGWGNTADTSAAIRAITTVSNYTLPSGDCQVEIAINGNKELAIEFYANSSLELTSQLYSLDQYLIEGSNNISLTIVGNSSIYYYFETKQLLRKNPLLSVESPIYSSPDEKFIVPIKIDSASENVKVIDLSIVNLEQNLEITSVDHYDLPVLEDNTTFYFSYQAPKTTGNYSLAGFEISYSFADNTLNHTAQGLVVKILSDISLVVEEGLEGSKKYTFNHDTSKEKDKSNYFSKSNQIPITLERTFSQTSGLSKGDIITVDLSITNSWESKEFVMIEEPLPAGCQLDLSSLNNQQLTVDYSVTSEGVTFFIESLSDGVSTLTYRLVVYNLAFSVALPTELSSMYDSWVVTSQVSTLGESKVLINPVNGDIKTDLLQPQLINLQATYQEESPYQDYKLDITVEDQSSISAIEILYLDTSDNWQLDQAAFECYNNKGQAVYSFTFDTAVENGMIYHLIITDEWGNNFYSQEYQISIPLIVIPIVTIIVIIIIAFIIASSGSIATTVYQKKRKPQDLFLSEQDLKNNDEKNNSQV